MAEETKKINYAKKQLIKKSENEIDNEEVALLVEETITDIKKRLLTNKKELIKLKREQSELKQTYPLDIDRYLQVTAKIQGLENGVQAVKDLNTELFPGIEFDYGDK